MSTTIILNKATRIEGNAGVHIEIEDGRVKSARFMVMDFRGFEKFVQGRGVEYMPQLVSRICGLCSSAHQVASLRAVEDALGVRATPSLEALREMVVRGETIASHALSYYYLSMPDRVGARGGVFELMQSQPGVMREAFALRKDGQEIVTALGKRAVHPVAMGVGRFLQPPSRDDLARVGEAARRVLERSRRLITAASEHHAAGERIPMPRIQRINFTAFDEEAGRFQVFDRNGDLAGEFTPEEFEDNVAEMRAEWSFSKFPYLKHHGFPEGIMLVGPLARSLMPGGMASDPEIQGFPLFQRLRAAPPALESHDTCRLLEIFWNARRILALLDEVDLGDIQVEVDLSVSGKGIGVLEAPRGILVHGYVVKEGRIDRVNLLVATQFNNPFINLLIRQAAEAHLEGDGLSARGDALIGRCIRLFDPCLSCAAH